MHKVCIRVVKVTVHFTCKHLSLYCTLVKFTMHVHYIAPECQCLVY